MRSKKMMLSAAVVICLVVYGIIALGSNRMISKLSDQQAAERWDKDGNYAQVTAFFAKGTAVDDFQIKGFEKNLEAALEEAAVVNENPSSRLYVDAYSGQGKVIIENGQTSVEVNAVGIGGDFFAFHPVKLLDGGYFSGNDLMKDSVILDNETAWKLFGSHEIEGMSIMIGGVPHYIAGVYEKDAGHFYEAAGLNAPLVFVSFETLTAYGSGGNITAYELLSPNPVKGFAANAVREKFGLSQNEMQVVENSARFSAEAMVSVSLDFGIRSMQNAAMQYPYWENVARAYEDVRALLFILQSIFLLIAMSIVIVFMVIKGRIGLKKAGKFVKSRMSYWCLFVLSVVSLCGCGRGSASEAVTANKDCIYRLEEIQLKEENAGGFSLLKSGEGFYAYCYNYDGGNPGTKIDFYSLDADGGIGEKHTLSFGENASPNIFRSDKQGNLYVIENVYATEPDENGVYTDKYYLLKMTVQGEELFRICLNDLKELEGLVSDGYFYAGDMLLSDTSIYLNIAGKYAEFDVDGNFVKIINAEGLDGAQLLLLENGKIAAVTYEDNGVYASYADLETGTFSDKAKLPGTSYEYSVYPGIGYDLYLVNYYGVYGYNVGEEEKTQLMNYIDSDLGMTNVFNLVPISETEFFASYDDMETYDILVGKFTKVMPEDVKEKKVLVLACNGLDWEIRRAVVQFNKSNEEYRISIEDYASLYGVENDYMASVNRLNNDIISGKVPDILVVDSNMPVESYIAKGLFEDLKPYVEADHELDMNDFMPNIIEAFSADGKWYQMVPSYSIYTLVARQSDVGEECGWTIGEAVRLLDSKPEGTEFLTFTTRDSVLLSSITMAGNQFIDWESGKCSFDSEGFIELLHFANRFPEEGNEVYTEDFWMNYDAMWREGKVICQITNISDFRNYNYVAKGSFGEPITMIGFPSENEEGTAIMPGMRLAMSAKSKNKEGTFAFMRYFLTDEYQKSLSYGLPLSMKQMDLMAEEAMKVPTYTDENGVEVESPELYYIGDTEIEIAPMTKEEVARLKEDISSVSHVYSYNENLIQIIQEEVAAFFSGQKTAEEVAGIVQSRAQIYVNENR